jgi:hypothetical protein
MRSYGHPIFKGRAFDFFSLYVLAPYSLVELPIRWMIEAPHMQAIYGWAFITPSSGRAEIDPNRLGDRIEFWLDEVRRNPGLINNELRPNVIQLPSPLDISMPDLLNISF